MIPIKLRGRSLLRIRSLLTNHQSPFTLHPSPFTVHSSLFALHCSLFTDHSSLITDHSSPKLLLSLNYPNYCIYGKKKLP